MHYDKVRGEDCFTLQDYNPESDTTLKFYHDRVVMQTAGPGHEVNVYLTLPPYELEYFAVAYLKHLGKYP